MKIENRKKKPYLPHRIVVNASHGFVYSLTDIFQKFIIFRRWPDFVERITIIYVCLSKFACHLKMKVQLKIN